MCQSVLQSVSACGSVCGYVRRRVKKGINDKPLGGRVMTPKVDSTMSTSGGAPGGTWR